MIAQIVFDLPLDGPFDYLVPEHLISQMAVGTRVKVSFGPKAKIGFVVGLLTQSAFPKLKFIHSLYDTSPVFNSLDLAFAQDFCAYYGCSLGEALGTMLGHKNDHRPSTHRDHKPLHILYGCQPNSYAIKIQEITDGYSKHHGDSGADKPEGPHFLILVPDTFRAQTLSQQLHSLPFVVTLRSTLYESARDGVAIKIGMRSSVFECDGRYDCVIMVDEEDASYKQEQMPMYETRQVLLMRSQIYGFDIAFVGISPSVELMAMVREGKVRLIEELAAGSFLARLVDLSNYRFVPGLLSPPVRDALEGALKAGRKSILVLNRRGSYRLTRCVDCGEILKCSHCDSPLIYSRAEGKYLCRHCTYTTPGDTACPKCNKPSWRSVGIGVEQLQTELKKHFPQAKIVAFERAAKLSAKATKTSVIASDRMERSDLLTLQDFDILISTQAVLRFQGIWQAQMIALIDFDAELNRLDMRSAFNAFSLVLHVGSMALGPVFIQTRNTNHYVLQGLSRGKAQGFYDEELKLRKEFGFSPFKHWIRISWRGKSEKSTRQAAQQVYTALTQSAPETYVITPPLPDAVVRKRDQFRFNVMVQVDHVPQAVAFIKSTFQKTKRPSRVIVTYNVDP